MKKSDFKEYNKEQLIDLLLDLSKLHKDNDAFLKVKLFSNYDGLFELSCKKIDSSFSCYELMSLKEANKALANFSKAVRNDSLLIDLCIYYIKRAYELEKTDWRFQENFYSAIEKTFAMIIKILKKDKPLIRKYNEKIKEILKNANEGWNHKETLKDLYNDAL